MKKITSLLLPLAALLLCSCGGKTSSNASSAAEEDAANQSATIDVLSDEFGSVDSVYYDAEGRIARVAQTGLDVYGEKKNAVTDDLTYSEYGKLIRVLHREERGQAEPLLTEHLFSYNREGLLSSILSRTVGQKKREQSKTVIAYKSAGKVKDIVNGNAVVECSYDEQGRLSAQKVTDKDENDEKIKDEAWTFDYDSLGRCTEVLAVVKKNVGLLNEDTVHNVFQFVYDQKDRLVKEVNCESVAIAYNYDSRGRQVSYVIILDDEHSATAINSQAAEPRKVLYRQQGSADPRSPYCFLLGPVCLTLDWFNSQEE